MASLLREGDTLSLSSEFELTKQYLEDVTLGAKHKITPVAHTALNLLPEPIGYTYWQAGHGLSPDEETELLNFLNLVGALSIRRSMMAKIKQAVAKAAWMTQGINLPSLTYRRPGRFLNITIAVLRSTAWLWASWPILLLLAYGSNIFSMSRFGLISGFSLACIISSVTLHEYCHVRLAGTQCSVAQQGLRLGVLHRQLGPQQELTSALVSPLVGALFACLLGLAGLLVDPMLPYFGLMIGIMHTASWLPWYGDGLTLLKWWRSKWA